MSLAVQLVLIDVSVLSIAGLSGTITSICYIPLTKVLWVLCGQQEVAMFDPKSGNRKFKLMKMFWNISFVSVATKVNGLMGKVSRHIISHHVINHVSWSGENITEYVSSQKSKGTESSNNNKYQLLLLQYVPELQEVFCTTNRRTVMVIFGELSMNNSSTWFTWSARL